MPPMIGSMCALGIDAMELLCQPPFDCVLLDAQHGVWQLDDLRHGIRAAEAMGVRPIVRLPVAGAWMIEALLDTGCDALLFPMVNSAAQARELVQACCYPPLGQRSQSTCRGSLRHGADYRNTFNDRFSLWIMIEHVEAVRQLPEILRVPGVTGCFVGPTDLASSRSMNDQSADSLEQLIQKVLAACVAADRKVGIAEPSMAGALRRIGEGFDLTLVSTDRKLLGTAVKSMADQWHSAQAAERKTHVV